MKATGIKKKIADKMKKKMSELPYSAVVGNVRTLSIAATINNTSEKSGILCFMKKFYTFLRIKSYLYSKCFDP